MSCWSFLHLPYEIILEWGFIAADPMRHHGLTFLTAFFLHADILHLAGNLYFLLMCGDNVEDYLGKVRFLFLLIFSTACGAGFYLLGKYLTYRFYPELFADEAAFQSWMQIPAIGASGGISGVLAFYALQFPKAKIGIMPGGILRFLTFFRIFSCRAGMLFLLWILWQLAGLFFPFSGIAYSAHLGGAMGGFCVWLWWYLRLI